MVISVSRVARVLLAFGLITSALCLPSSLLAEVDEASYYAQGEEAYQRFDYAAAKANYVGFYGIRGAINNTPGQRSLNIYVMTQLGKCCRHLEQFDEARTWFARIISTFAEDSAVCCSAQYEIGLTYGKNSKEAEAIAALEKVITDYPQERGLGAYALLKIAKMRNRPDYYDQVISTLQRLLREYPEKKTVCAEAKWLLAEVLDNSSRINDALGVLNGIAQDNEYSVEEKGEALVKVAGIQARAGRWQDARTTAQRILTDYAAWTRFCREAKWTMIQALQESGDPSGAMALIEELRADPKCQRAETRATLTLWTGACYWGLNDNAKAEEHFTKVITEFGGLTGMVDEGHFHRARLRISTGKLEEAAADIDMIGTAYLKKCARGDLHFRKGDYANAVTEYEGAVAGLPEGRIMPNEPVHAFNQLATCYSRLGQEDKSGQARQRLEQYQAAHNR